LKFKSL